MVGYNKIPIYYNHFSKNEKHYLMTATSKLLADVTINPEQDPRLHKGIGDFQQLLLAYDRLGPTPKEEVVNLTQLDQARDRDFRDLRDHIRIQSRSRQANKQAAALKLSNLLEAVKKLHRLSHSEQSSQLGQLLKQLEEKENRGLVRTIGAEDLFLNLKESQEKFEAAHLRKMAGKSQKAKSSKREAWEGLLKLYKNLYRYLIAIEEFGIDDYHRPVLAIFNDVRLSFLEKQQKKDRQEKKK